jgi:hypothetical protein
MRFDDAVERVLESWEGTPEELGATLEQSFPTIWSWQSRESKRKDQQKKTSARKRILACPGGEELLALEGRRRKRK